MKKKSTITIIAIIAVLVLYGVRINNSMVSLQEEVSTAWSNVENVYQRRADLIPNLVSTVKGYAAHESQTLQAVVEARTKATSISIDGSSMTAQQFQEFQEAQNQVSGALGRLIAISESYPDLKANQNFLELQSQLEGTENRISVERRNFNEAARKYNTYIRKFPNSIFAGILNFDAKPYFEAQEGSETAPKVEF